MIDQLTQFFGWSTAIHFGLLLFTTLIIVPFGTYFSEIHAKMFALNAAEIRVIYFRFLAFYKTLILFFAAVPWLVLRFCF